MSSASGNAWGTPVQLAGGYLTHWAGREVSAVRLLAHGDYAWRDMVRAPVEMTRACRRCVRRQPYFVKRGVSGG